MVAVSSTSVYISNDTSLTFAPTPSPTPQPPTPSPTPQPAEYCSSINSNLDAKSVSLYIVFTLLFLGIGLLTYSVRRTNTEIVVFSPVVIAAEMVVLGLDITSDILYIISLYSFYSFVGIATVLVTLRVVHPCTSVYILYCIMGKDKANDHYSKLIDNKDIAQNAKVYGILLITAVLEVTTIKFLPWRKSKFSEVSGGYPDMFTFRLCAYSKMVQSIVSTVMQVTILARLNQKIRSGSCVVIVSVTFVSTLLSVLLSTFEIVFQDKNSKKLLDEVKSNEMTIRIEDSSSNPIHS